MAENLDFTKNLLDWNAVENSRPMPWKGEKDPYKIWLSEIILQQTRVEQGWSYYEKFIEAYPTVKQLAKAPEKKIFKLWEGLGYYSRCRNLIDTARKIAKDFNGKFPDSFEEIKKLKGVGPYTASAIASFAFNLPHAVVDGNVERVLSRYFGVTAPVDISAGKKFYNSLAFALLDKKNPGIYNQAMMDFGAVICKPQNPQCANCVQAKDCMAFRHDWISLFPVKARSIVKKNRWFYYFIVETNDGRVYIRKRDQKDIWKNLYEFVLWETGQLIPQSQLLSSRFTIDFFRKIKYSAGPISKVYRQQLTHQTIHGQFIYLRLQKPLAPSDGYILVEKDQLQDYPFPKLINEHLQNPVQQLF